VSRRESGGEQEHGKLASVKELRKQQKTKKKQKQKQKQQTGNIFCAIQTNTCKDRTTEARTEHKNKRANETNREGCVTIISRQQMNFYDRLVSCNVQNQNKVMQQG